MRDITEGFLINGPTSMAQVITRLLMKLRLGQVKMKDVLSDANALIKQAEIIEQRYGSNYRSRKQPSLAPMLFAKRELTMQIVEYTEPERPGRLKSNPINIIPIGLAAGMLLR